MQSCLFVLIILLLTANNYCLQFKIQDNAVYSYTYTCKIIVDKTPTILESDIDLHTNSLKTGDFLFKLVLKSFRLGTKEGHLKPYAFTNYPAFIAWDTFGRVGELYVANTETLFWINFFKGFASFLHVNINREGEIKEIDVSGECTVNYTFNEGRITKIKENCTNIDLTHESHATDFILKKRSNHRLVNNYHIEGGFIKRAIGHEIYSTENFIGERLKLQIFSWQHLELKNKQPLDNKPIAATKSEFLKSTQLSFNLLHLGSSLITSQEDVSKETLNKLLGKESVHLQKHGETPSVELIDSFSRLLPHFRNIKTSDIILAVLKDEERFELLPPMLDLTIACQTPVCLKAIFDFMDLNNTDDDDMNEHILFALSQIPQPRINVIDQLLHRLKVSKISLNVKSQVYHTLTSLAKKCFANSQLPGLSSNVEQIAIINEIIEILIAEINMCSKKDCYARISGAIENLGSSALISQLLNVACDKSTTTLTKCAALKALKRLPIPNDLKNEVKSKLYNLFHEQNFKVNTNVKLMCIDILFANFKLTKSEIASIFDKMSNNTELFHSSLNKYKTMCLETESSMNCINSIFTQLVISQFQTTPFSSYVHSNIFSNGNATAYFELDILYNHDGVFIQSRMDVLLRPLLAETLAASLFSVNLHASGLETLVPSSKVDNDNFGVADDITAGMSLNILGVELRPMTFFTGKSGLMSAAWNAPADQTSILSAILLFEDSSHSIHLQNGFVAQHFVTGIAMFDISGSMSISMWSQTAESLVSTVSAVRISSSMVINTPIISVTTSRIIKSVGTIDFKSLVNAGVTPMQVCMIMSRPDMKVTFLSENDKIINNEHPVKFERKRSLFYPGESFNLGSNNSKQCKIMAS